MTNRILSPNGGPGKLAPDYLNPLPDRVDGRRIARQAGISPVLDFPANASVRKPSKTLLFVEDDAALRESTAYCLNLMDFDVLPCSNADLASQRFRAQGRVDLLLTDFEMPGRTGMELARELTGLQPSLPVLVVSGSILPNTLTAEIEERQWSFLSKPCPLTVLVRTIRSLLRQPRPMPETMAS